MKTYIIPLIFSFISISAFCQDENMLDKKEIKKIAKEEKRAKIREDRMQEAEIVKSMLENRKFVLEASFRSYKNGDRHPVNSTINFIAIDSTMGTIQVGSPTGLGYNGVGGITVDGRITKYDLKINTKKNRTSYTLILIISTGIGTFDITYYISETGNTDATVRGATSGQLRYSGKLVPIGVSDVYKGNSIF